ncbi:ubiquitin-specific protease ubp15, partial [Coemansia sp. RSA 2399]
FPPTIDLEEFLSDDADRSQSWKYTLHGVLVHSGDVHGGHYFGLLRPTTENKWYRFDDDRVVPIHPEEVFEEYYGGEFPQTHNSGMRMRQNSKRFTNAYMLVYIREALSDRVMCKGDAPVPEHLIKRIQQDKDDEERRIRERQELANMTRVTVIGREQFAKHQGFDLCQFNQRQAKDNQLYSELVPRNMTLGDFKKLYGDRYGLKTDDFRLWTMVARVNKTIRCDVPLVGESIDMTLAQLKENRGPKWPDVRLFCEERSAGSPERFHLEKPKQGTNLVHIKYYMPEEERMVGLGNLYAQSDQPVASIIPALRKMAGLPDDASLTLYEEVKPSLVEEMETALTFQRAEIQSGDIICFQQSRPEINTEGELNTVTKFFDDMENRVSIEFVERPARNDGDSFGNTNQKGSRTSVGAAAAGADSDSSNNDKAYTMVASTKMPYDQVAQRLAEEIGERDPMRLRFYTVGPNGQMRQPVRRMTSTTLGDMLPTVNYAPPPINADGLKEYLVMYERMEVNIMQIEKLRSIRVTYIGKNMKDEHAVEVLVPKIGTAHTLMEATYAKVENALRSKAQGGGDAAAAIKPFALRFYAVNGHRVKRVIDGSENIDDLGGLRLGEVVAEYVNSEEQTESEPKDDETRMDTDEDPVQGMGVDVEVFHFYRDLGHTHGVPFLFRIYAGEAWADTWARLERRLGLGEKELKSMGVVVGSHGAADLQACQVVQEGSVGMDNTKPANSLGTGQNTPSVTPPPPAAATIKPEPETDLSAVDPTATANGDDAQQKQQQPSEADSNKAQNGSESASSGNGAVPIDASSVCVWDIIQRMVSEQEVMDDSSGTPRTTPGFIGLNHIDRSSRHRGVHQERAIRILN